MKPASNHMITSLKQVLWRNRHLIVMAPGSDAVHVVVFEETLRGPLRRESHLFQLDDEPTESADVQGLAQWEQFLQRHLEDSWIIVLPHQVTISQWMDLDSTESDQLEARLEEQTQQLVGLGESNIVVDYVEVPSSQPGRAAYWITYCQESEVQKIIHKYGLHDVAICDVVADADAIFAGLQTSPEGKRTWVLLDVRDGGTSTIFFEGKYPRYCSFFPIGNEMAQEQGTRSPGPIRVGIHPQGRDWEIQRTRKGVPVVSSEWGRDVLRAWQEYRVSILKENQTDTMDCPVIVLADERLLNVWNDAARNSLQVSLLKPDSLWPNPVLNLQADERRHWGAVLAMQRKHIVVPSLLPESIKSAWNDKQVGMIWRSMALLSCMFAVVVMLMAVIQKGMLWKMKNELIQEVQGIEQRLDQGLVVLEGFKQEYRMLQPLIQAEQKTYATLQILGAMQQIRTNQTGWMVLLADKDSYYAADALDGTNSITLSNLIAKPLTNQVDLRRGFILELVLKSDGETMREELAEWVAFFRDQDFLHNADILPADARRPLANTNRVIAGKHFAISLEMDSDGESKMDTSANREPVEGASYRPVWRELQPVIQSPSVIKEEGP